MSKYRTGFRNFAYRVGGGTKLPLPGAQNLSFKEQTATRSVLVRTNRGAMTYSDLVGNGKNAELDIVQLPVHFLINVLGYTLSERGVLSEGLQSTSVHFALFYEGQTDDVPVRTQLYDVACSKPDFDVTSMADKPTVNIRKLKLIINPSDGSGNFGRSISRSDNEELFDTWFGLEGQA